MGDERVQEGGGQEVNVDTLSRRSAAQDRICLVESIPVRVSGLEVV